MIHSYLITSGSKEDRTEKALNLAFKLLGLKPSNREPRPDLLIIDREEKNSIGIDKIRTVKSFLNLKPFESKSKVIIITDSELLTLEAQNALLKTLEEPPGSSYMIMVSPNKLSLLPTIVSRCAIINVHTPLPGNIDWGSHQKEINEFLNTIQSNLGQRLDYTEKNKNGFSKKEDVLKRLDFWILILRNMLFDSSAALSPTQIQKAIKGLLLLKSEIATTNVSPRNLIELFLLKLPVSDDQGR